MHADRVADTDVKSRPWHTYSDPELFQKVASCEQGLQAAEVPPRLAQFGRNTLEAGEAVSLAKLVLKQLHNPLIYLLLGAAALSLATGHAIEADGRHAAARRCPPRKAAERHSVRLPLQADSIPRLAVLGSAALQGLRRPGRLSSPW